jgi:CBS domain-containing protein
MRISDVMSRDVCVIAPDDTLGRAAGVMAKHDIGSLPVGENDRLVGFITDRDIVVRALAQGMDADAAVREVMSREVKYCYADDDLDEVAMNMADLELRRLPVVDREKRLVGIVSLANFAHSRDTRASQELLQGVARPH